MVHVIIVNWSTLGGREGGQKCPKIGPHGLSMTPIRAVSTMLLDKVQIVSCSKNKNRIDPLAESAKTFIISQTE